MRGVFKGKGDVVDPVWGVVWAFIMGDGNYDQGDGPVCPLERPTNPVPRRPGPSYFFIQWMGVVFNYVGLREFFWVGIYVRLIYGKN